MRGRKRRGRDTRSVSKIYIFHLPPLPLPSSFRLFGSSENAPAGAGGMPFVPLLQLLSAVGLYATASNYCTSETQILPPPSSAAVVEKARHITQMRRILHLPPF